jgi:hypothetical protein
MAALPATTPIMLSNDRRLGEELLSMAVSPKCPA